MRRILLLSAVLVVMGGAVVLGERKAAPDEMARSAVIKLYQSLSDEQKKLAVKSFDDKERSAVRFPTERGGVPITEMTAEQKMLVDDLFRAMLSEYGAARCREMGGHGKVIFFGTPKENERFACRLDKNNHLTLIYAEFGTDQSGEFGPILLGAKGAGEKMVWVEEDQIAVELAAALTPEEARKIKGKGNFGAALDDTALRIGELGDKPRGLARKLLEQRLAVFSTDRRKILDDVIQKEGGVDKLRIAFWGDASKSNAEGGNYSWKIGGSSFSCAWQHAGKNHPHMTLSAKRPK